jgi:hypothetical protein
MALITTMIGRVALMVFIEIVCAAADDDSDIFIYVCMM